VTARSLRAVSGTVDSGRTASFRTTRSERVGISGSADDVIDPHGRQRSDVRGPETAGMGVGVPHPGAPTPTTMAHHTKHKFILYDVFVAFPVQGLTGCATPVS
jgi:hypothetical protein